MKRNAKRIDAEIPDIEYDPETERYRTVHERGRETSLATTLLLAVGTVTNVEPTELPPLFERIDTDALDRLFDPIETAEHQRLRGRVTFLYANCLVTIYEDDEITFRPLAGCSRTNHG